MSVDGRWGGTFRDLENLNIGKIMKVHSQSRILKTLEGGIEKLLLINSLCEKV